MVGAGIYHLSLRKVRPAREEYFENTGEVLSCRYFFEICTDGYNRKMLDGVMENIVFLELKRRGYDAFIGKNDTKEIDFVAIRRDEKIYVQVCVQLPEKSDREVGNLMEIKDHYPKYVVTLNDLDVGIENGIKIVHLSDFLLSSQW